MKVLALTEDGRLTMCACDPNQRGYGRCNHVIHKSDNQTTESFMNFISSESFRKTYDVNFSTPICEIQDNNIKLKANFGLRKARGIQLKGTIILNENGEYKNKYIKIDALNPANNFHYINNEFSTLHPSIAEAICSCVIKSSNIGLNSVTYDFIETNVGDYKYTASMSDNFIIDRYYEDVLCRHYDEKGIIKHDDYVKNVIDSSNQELILNFLNESFQKKTGTDEDFKSFIIQQAGFDLLFNNKDRKNNSENFVFIKNADGKIIPVNMDYGRTLCTMWTITTENAKPSDEIIDMVVKMNMDHESRCVFGSNTSKNIDFIKKNGFKKFKIDMNQMNKNFDDLLNKTKETEVEYYTKFLIKFFKSHMNRDDIKELWEEV